MFVNNPEWALKFLEEGDIVNVRQRVADQQRGQLTSSHSQHRLNHLKTNLKSAQEDAAELKNIRRVLVDEYTKKHYQVAEGERIVRVNAKPKNDQPGGKAMKALVENTFAGGLRTDHVEAQMRSSLREKLMVEAVQDGPGGMPSKKLCMLNNPLMAADTPYNRRQDVMMGTMLTTGSSYTSRSTVRNTARSAHAKAVRATTPEREGNKFRSLSRFLTTDNSKYMKDPRFAKAMEKMMKRAKQMDSRAPSTR